MVVLKNCGPEISYILAKLFGIGLKNLIFQIAGRSHLWSLYLRMLGEMSVAKNYCPVVSRLSAVSKVFEKLVNNRIADHLKKCFRLSNMVLGLLDHLQTFWQLYLTELLGLLTDLGLLKQWHAGFLHRLKSYEIQFRYDFISSFLSNRRVRVLQDGNSSQEYPVNAGIPKGSILGPKHSYYNLMTFLISSRVLLSILILLSTVGLIRHLIFGDN